MANQSANWEEILENLNPSSNQSHLKGLIETTNEYLSSNDPCLWQRGHALLEALHKEGIKLQISVSVSYVRHRMNYLQKAMSVILFFHCLKRNGNYEHCPHERD